MKKITFLGLGAMGSRMAKKLAKFDAQVCVWSRSGISHKDQIDPSHEIINDINQAVIDADVIFCMVRDDQASQNIWLTEKGGVLEKLKKDAIVVECSTLSPDWVKNLSDACESKQVKFVEAPVIGSRPQADACQLIQLISSDENTYQKILPMLQLWSKEIFYLGEKRQAAHLKLAINTLFSIQMAGIAELLSYFKKYNIDLLPAMSMIGKTPVCSPVVIHSAMSMINQTFTAAFPIELVVKDLSYFISSNDGLDPSLSLAKLIKGNFEKAIDQGWAHENITAIAKVYAS